MSLIHSEETWLLLSVMISVVALGIWLESRYKWAAKMSALVLILLSSILLSNLHLIPTEAAVYDFVWEKCLPLALPLLLFQSNLKKICRESGQLLIAFLIGAAGTVTGAFTAYAVFKNVIPEISGLSAMMTGTYIGGSVNFAVLARTFHVSGSSVSAATIADNLNMAIYLLVLFGIPIQKKYGKLEQDKEKTGRQDSTEIKSENQKLSGQENCSGTKEGSIQILSAGLALSVAIVAVSNLLADIFTEIIPDSNPLLMAVHSLTGNCYMWITTFSVLLATVFPKKMEKLKGLQEIGTFFIYCFMFVIGAPASVTEIIRKSPLLLLFALVIVACNMLFVFGIGSLLHIDRKTLILASNANVGGPTTAASMAIAKEWDELIGPSLLVGCFGYVIGNYMGLIVGNILS